jgi:hypothetical protein
MSGIAYLAWRYLAYHRIKTGVLIAAVTVIVYLPIGLNLLLHRTADQLMSRAEATPLLIGARGSRLELVLNSLYFESDAPATIRFDEAERVEASGWARQHPAGHPVPHRWRAHRGNDAGLFRVPGAAVGRWADDGDVGRVRAGRNGRPSGGRRTRGTRALLARNRPGHRRRVPVEDAGRGGPGTLGHAG